MRVRKFAPALLLPLLAAGSKPERVDPLLRVGPLVHTVVVGSKTLEPEGDFFRAVLANAAVIVSGLLWLVYAVYEHQVATGVLCDSDCNIRVDLVFFFPLLGFTTSCAFQA